MDRNKIKERLELALRPAEPPTIEEVLEQVSRRGVLRGPVDWVFPAWMLYVEYATQRIAETFPLSEEEKRQLLHFRDTLTQLLLEAQKQAKTKLTALYKAVVEGTYSLEGKRLYAPDGAWMYANSVPRIPIHGVSADTYFPDVLKLSREKLKLFQLGWRASDEGNERSWPVMSTSQPWQLIAWVVTRYGEFRMRITLANLTYEGISVVVRTTARSWRQRWSKMEAIDLVTNHFRRGEWAPLLTAWLGDGVFVDKYRLVIVSKEPWRLGKCIGTKRALVTRGREAFVKLGESAGAYGVLLDVLQPHKWINVKLTTDDGFRAVYKMKKRNIEILRKTYGRNNDEIPTEQFSQADRQRSSAVAVAGIIMYLHLVGSKGGSLMAGRYFRDVRKALAVAGRLESAGLRPNIVKSGPNYMVYITMADLLRLAKEDKAVRRAIALFLAEKAKNGTPRQREIAEKILRRYPSFSISQRLSVSSKPTLLFVSQY